jgi:hypothetical protein
VGGAGGAGAFVEGAGAVAGGAGAAAGGADGVADGGDGAATGGDGVGAAGDGIGAAGVGVAAASLDRRKMCSLTKEVIDDIALPALSRTVATASKYPEACRPRGTRSRKA